MLAQQRHSHHGACAQAPANLHIDPGVVFRVVATDNAASAETRAGKSRGGIQAHALVWRNGACRTAAHNRISLGKSYGHAIRARDRHGALRDQVEHFVQDELLNLPGVVSATNLMCATLTDLFVQGRKGEQRL